jgi:disulfide bond formation protein DsbB
VNVRTVSIFLATGAVVIAAGLIIVVVLWALSRFVPGARRLLNRIQAGFARYGLWFAWIMAVVATLGSLYYSQIAHFIPCEYCWYQRIAMYPLALILGIAAFKGDERVRRYVYPIAVIGAGISTYHYLIQHMPDLATGVCSTLTPCTAALVWQFDFVSIPFMALVSFGAIIASLALDRDGTATANDQDAVDRPQGAA